MPQIVLLVGVLLLVYGVAVLAGGRVAGSSPMRAHSRAYGLVTAAAGALLLVAGTGLLLRS